MSNSINKSLRRYDDSYSNTLTRKKFEDKPYERVKLTNLDKLIGNNIEAIAKSRLAALKSISAFSNEAIPGASNWVQIGPTATPGGGTISSYYYWEGLLPPEEVKEALVTGRVTAIVTDPSDPNSNTIYVGTALGGVWKTTDGGRNWFPTSDDTDSMAIGTLVMDPVNNDVLYAGTGEGNFSGDSYYGLGVLKTIDGGKKWLSCGDQQRELFFNSRFCRLVISPEVTTTLFAAVRSSENTSTAAGIFRSVDGGITWKRLDKDLPSITNNVGATDIVLDPNKNSKVAYASFYGIGVYKTDDIYAEDPSWILQDLKDLSPGRICLAISPSSPNIVYVLANDKPQRDKEDYVNQFYRTTDAGNSWDKIKIPISKGTSAWKEGTIGGQGDYNLNVAVDPKSPDIVYLSGVSLWKAILNSATNEWIFTDIGKAIHPDNHALAFDPKNPFVIYAGNDGGIYKSIDGGETWNDTINEGLCITQFEFMDQHPSSDAVIFAGTQDNGTLQFRNNSVFYSADGGDGGFVSIDPSDPHNVIHQYIQTSLFHSRQAGQKDSWISIAPPIGNYPTGFYAPFALDKENPKNIAFGAKDAIIFDKNQGLDGWRTSQGELDYVQLPNMDPDYVTALNYVSSYLLYVGTDHGKIFRITKSGDRWNDPIEIRAPDALPDRWIWDIASYPKKDDTIVVVMSGYLQDLLGGSHVWRGTISEEGTTTWDDIAPRNDKGEIIDIPVNSVVIDEDEKNPDNIYIGTDIGVFKTTDNGNNWKYFNEGLPKCAVYDMRLIYKPQKLLRLVTHGRGMWERRLDVSDLPAVDIFVRDHLMDTGRFTPSSTWPESVEMRSAFDEPLQDIKLGDSFNWTMCPDIKIDASKAKDHSYQMNIEDVDYVKFETKLYHRNPRRARVNRVYVQVHNRGIRPVDIDLNEKVIVKLLYANLIDQQIDSRQYLDLPQDFWSTFPENSKDTTYWKPIGEAKFLPSGSKTMTNTEPTILEWDWYIPPDVANLLWLLVVVECTADRIPQSNKLFELERLVRNEKHIGVKLVSTDTA
jgi:photosystem II stability/assembly factor-like uncharacterized protein